MLPPHSHSLADGVGLGDIILHKKSTSTLHSAQSKPNNLCFLTPPNNLPFFVVVANFHNFADVSKRMADLHPIMVLANPFIGAIFLSTSLSWCLLCWPTFLFLKKPTWKLLEHIFVFQSFTSFFFKCEKFPTLKWPKNLHWERVVSI